MYEGGTEWGGDGGWDQETKTYPPRAPPLPEQGPGFRFSKEPFACGVHLPLMDDSKLVRLVMRGIDPGGAPDMGPDQCYCTVGGSPEDTGSAGEGASLGSAGWRSRTLLSTQWYSKELFGPGRRSC